MYARAGMVRAGTHLGFVVEFRARTNGLGTPAGNGLVGALIYFGLDTIGAQTKDAMRDLVLRGGPWSETERADILQYCASDVDALERLLPAMLPHIDLPRALLRGRYMAAAAAIEHNGIPIDVSTLTVLRAHWTDIQDALISDIDADYGVFDGRTFRTNRFEAFLARRDIPWPRLESGSLDLDRDTFRQMAKSYPIISPLRELRHALSEMRLNDLAVGHDGRNRTLLSVFSSKTGRNQPSNSKYIFGPSAWLRGLIKPSPGHAVAYIDWSNQELELPPSYPATKRCWKPTNPAIPISPSGNSAGNSQEATKSSHADARQLFKQCVLGIQYGMEAKTLAFRIGQPEIVARELLRAHRETYKVFWKWSDAAVDYAMLGRTITHGVRLAYSRRRKI